MMLSKPLRRMYRCALTYIMRWRYPYAVDYRMDITKFDAWYRVRYDWMIANVPDAQQQIWLARQTLRIYDQHSVNEVWVQGSLRFRRSRDRLMFLLRWS